MMSALFEKFQCRKRHMFVATIEEIAGDCINSKFQCRKRHMFVATQLSLHMMASVAVRFNAASGICSLQLKVGKVSVTMYDVSMPQAAYVRCNSTAVQEHYL